ncbi:Mitogen-activated protein kinase kinase kinase [Lachnellula suecica]|uniref:Mitogen-activated protein kinase kinase kinase n=1 Tax=Lachnellula suecica TaxID=602035 RepID=A0A8T9C6R5_9HELO|nr:Mitogen-activated protein kinase kinase kinase [Lachnellula suecica]
MSPVTIAKTASKGGWKLWFDSYDAFSVGRGSSGTVLAIDDKLVIKTYVEDEEGERDFRREKAIYEILQSGTFSPYIVKFVEEWESGLVLERLRGTLRSRLKEKVQPCLEDRTQWIREACNGLGFLHENRIMHGDVGCHNFLVDYSGHVKLCDFAGSKREGELARICYEIRGQHPDYKIGNPTIETEIFALTDDFVREMFRRGKLPLSEVKCARMKSIIEECWTEGYASVSHVSQALSSVPIRSKASPRRPGD